MISPSISSLPCSAWRSRPSCATRGGARDATAGERLHENLLWRGSSASDGAASRSASIRRDARRRHRRAGSAHAICQRVKLRSRGVGQRTRIRKLAAIFQLSAKLRRAAAETPTRAGTSSALGGHEGEDTDSRRYTHTRARAHTHSRTGRVLGWIMDRVAQGWARVRSAFGDGYSGFGTGDAPSGASAVWAARFSISIYLPPPTHNREPYDTLLTNIITTSCPYRSVAECRAQF